MASPKAHAVASVGLLVVIYIVGFFVGFSLSLMDIIWLVAFSVLIDGDHIPFGRLWRAFRIEGVRGVLGSWKKYGWFDADHLNIMHTWWALVAVTIFSYVVGNLWPLAAFVVHMLIDAGSLDQNDYPKCSPMPGWLLRHFALRYYPKWALYHTAGVPEKH